MKRILCYGDSNTFGMDGVALVENGRCHRFDENTRWTSLLQEKLGNDWRLAEAGLCGRTTVFDDPMEPGRNGLATLDVTFLCHQPVDLVIVMLGTNDLKDLFHASAYAVTLGMEQILLRLQELIAKSESPDAKILLLCPTPIRESAQGYQYDFSAASVEKAKELSWRYQALAQKHHCLYADVGQWVTTDLSDGVHLTPDAHRIIAEKVLDIIQQQMP